MKLTIAVLILCVGSLESFRDQRVIYEGQRLSDPISLGIVKLGSGTTSVSYRSASVPVGGSVDLKGQLKNETGAKVTDVSVEVEAIKPPGSVPPSIGSVNVNGGTATGGSGTTQVNVGLSGAQTIQIGGQVPVTVDLLPPPSGSTLSEAFKIHFTPSVPMGMAHFDFAGSFEVTSASGVQVLTIGKPYNSGMAAWVENKDTSRQLISFSGIVVYPGQQNFIISSVEVRDEEGQPLAGATATITEHAFTVAGIQLAAGARIMLYVDTDTPPIGGSDSLKISSTQWTP